jgi:hypothetical protein
MICINVNESGINLGPFPIKCSLAVWKPAPSMDETLIGSLGILSVMMSRVTVLLYGHKHFRPEAKAFYAITEFLLCFTCVCSSLV